MKRRSHHSSWFFVKAVSLYALLLLGLLSMVFGTIYTAFAEPSYTINYQGKLSDSTGVTVANGTYQLVFKLYTAPTGGAAIWTETRSGANEVTVTNGLFSVMLGSITSIASVNFNQALYLGVTVEADAEMTPRKLIGSVPSAFETRQLGGVASTSFLRSDQADSASSLLTFTGGLISNSSTTIKNLSTTNATTTSLYIGGDRITDFTGTGLAVTGNALGISASYLGQTSITTLGTITTGTWNGTAINSSYLDTNIILSSEIDTSSELAALLGDETGSGRSVFSVSPAFSGTATFAALSATSTLTLSGTAANIALGSNYLSGDGGDEGVFVDGIGLVGIGTAAPSSALEVVGNIVSKGTQWTSRSAAGNNDQWRSVVYGNGLYVTVGVSGDRVMTSPDGVNWTTRTAAGDDDAWWGLTYANGLFVAVGQGASGDHVMTSSDGVTWTARSAAGNDDTWWSITYGNGLFVAVGSGASGDHVITSPDGITWTARTAGGDNDGWQSVVYASGQFVAVGGSGDLVMTSPDGVTWTTQSATGNNDNWLGITYGNGLFVAVADGVSGDHVITSPDGTTWTGRTAAGDNDGWNGVGYGNGVFVAISYSGDRVMTSPDGTNWVARTAAGNDDTWYGITYGNGRFVATAYGGGDRLMTSGQPETSLFASNNLYQGGASIFGTLQLGTSTRSTIGTHAALSVQGAGTDLFNLFNTSGSKIFNVLASGNVGIGTSTPYAKLSVAGDVVARTFAATSTTATSSFPRLYASTAFRLGSDYLTDITGTGLSVSSGALTVAIGNDYITPNMVKTSGQTDEYCLTYESSGTTFEWQTCGPASLFTDGGATTYLTATGDNFAIGTTTANQALTLFRNAADSALEFSSASGANYKWTAGIDYSDAGKFKISSSSALGTNDRFVINGNGNVGIGDSNPANRLTVVGNASFTGYTTTASSYADTFGSLTGATNLVINAAADLRVLTNNGGTEAMRITTAGNIGIGTTTPNQKLTVQGNINLSAATGAIYFDDTKYLYASSTNDSIVFGENAGATFTSGTIYNTAIGFEAGRYASTSNSDYNNFTGYQSGFYNTGLYNNISGYQAGYKNIGNYNNISGYRAGYNNTYNQNNIFGEQAGYNNSGQHNNLLGTGAGYNSSGYESNILGREAGYNNSATGANLFGYRSGYNNTGDYINAFGANAGYSNTGDNNNFIGPESGRNNSGDYNNSLGYQAGYNNAATSTNIFGYQAGYSNTGDYVNILGYQAGYRNTADYNNIIGYEAAGNASSSAGTYNNFFGYYAGYNNTGTENNFFGDSAGYNNTGANNNFFGRGAGANNSGDSNSIIGWESGYNNTGEDNIIMGFQSGYNNVDRRNILIGVTAGRTNTGESNVALGYQAGYDNTGDYNNILGFGAADNNTGSYNNIFGSSAGLNNRGDENELIGYQAGYENNGDYNQIIGSQAGRYLKSTTTVAIGAQALYGPGSAYESLNNVALGYRAGYVSAAGSGNNILIGYKAADNLTTGNNNIIIGYDIDNITATADNKLNIGNLLFGTGLDGTGTTLASGNIGIGTTTPTAKLDVQGSAEFGTGNVALITAGGKITGLSSTYFGADTSANLASILTDETGTGVAVFSASPTFTGAAIFAGATFTTATTTNLVVNAERFTDLTGTGLTFSSNALTVSLANDYITPNMVKSAGQTDEFCLTYESTGTTWEWQTCGGGSLLFTDGGATTYLTASGDNLGIGTSTANQKLTVEGSINLSAATGAIYFDDTKFIYASSTNSSIVFGNLAGTSLTSATINNNFIGKEAGKFNFGRYNNFFGFQAGFSSSNASYNNIIGNEAGRGITGSYNDIMGYKAGRYLISTSTVAIGGFALYGDNGVPYTGLNNVAIGYRTGYYADTGAENNVLIGYQAGENLTTGNNNIIIGYDIDNITATADNKLNIGNLLFGTGLDGTGTTLASGNIGIGTTTPTAKLDVQGSAEFGTGNVALITAAGKITGLSTTYFGTDNSASLGGILTDETGAGGNVVFSSGPTLTGTTNLASLIASASSSFSRATFTTATTTNLVVNGERFTDLTGTGLAFSSNALTVSLANDYVTPNMVKTSGQTDEYCLTYESTGTTWEWQTCGSGGTMAIGSAVTSGTTGSVLFVDGGNLAQDNANFFFNNTTNRLGLGTTTPNHVLTVQGNINLSDMGGSIYFDDTKYLYASSTNDSLVFGEDAGRLFNGNALDNIAIGWRAGYAATSSDYNIFIGSSAGRNTTSGGYNLMVGNGAGLNNDSGSYNVFLGYNAGNNNISSESTYVGYLAGATAYGAKNVALGSRALFAPTTSDGVNNVALGQSAGYSIANGGNNNILIGYEAGYNLTSGNNNIIIGYDIDNITATADNVLNIGNLLFGTGFDGTGTTLASGNIGIGTTTPYAKLSIRGTAGQSTAFAVASSTGSNLLSVDKRSVLTVGRGGGYPLIINGGGTSNNLGGSSSYNTVMGNLAFRYLTTSATDNTAFGYAALQGSSTVLMTGYGNAAFGEGAGDHITSGYQNTFIGASSGYYVTSGFGNNFSGYSSGERLTTGTYNTFSGWRAGYLNTTGSNNAFFGASSGQSNTTGKENVYIGMEAGYGTNGTANVFIGYESVYGSSGSMSSSTILGYQAGYIVTGSKNILLGYKAGDALGSGSNNIIIGYDIDNPSNTASNKLNIGNLIYGTNLDGSGTTLSTGNIGIGTSTAGQRLGIFNNANDAAIELSSASGSTYKWAFGIDYSDGAKFKISSSSVLGTNDRFTISGNGNVGIGDTTPTALLTVGAADNFTVNSSGVISSSNNITPNSILSSGQSDEFCLTYESTGTTFEWQTCGGVALFTDGGASTYLTSTSDNLAVGTTTSPDQKLTVYNSIASGDAALEFSGASGSTYKWTVGMDNGTGVFKISSSTALGTNDRLSIDGSGNFDFSGAAQFGTGNVNLITSAGKIAGLSTTYFGTDTSANLAAILTNETGAAAGSPVAVFSESPTIVSPTFTTNATVPLIYGGSAAGSSFTLQSTSGAGTTDFIKFAVGNAGAVEAARFTTLGRMGIGTTTPNQQLSLFKSAANVGLEFSGASGSTYKWTVGMDYTNGGKFKISSSTAFGTNDRLTIDGNGNVGIGDNSPLALLTVGSGDLFRVDSSGRLLLPNGASGAGNLALSAVSDTNTGFYFTGSDVMRFQTGGSDRVTITSAGRVGIGTTTPNWELNVASTNPYLALTDTDAASGNKHLHIENENGVFKFGTTSDSLAAETTALTYNPAGAAALGVGTSTPWRTLSIVGTAAFNGLSAVAGTDNSICIDPTTKEITTQAGDTCAVSAARYKHDINKLDNDGLDMLMQLDAVSYIYNDDPSNTLYWGLIADQAASTSRQLAYFNPDGSVQTLNTFGFLALFTKSIQELNLNLNSIASTTATSTPASRSFAEGFFKRIGDWLGEKTNGITSLFAKKVETEKLCVSDGSGKTCITKSQLDDLLDNANTASVGDSDPPPEPDLVPEPDPTPEPIPDPEPTPEPQPEPAPESPPEQPPV